MPRREFKAKIEIEIEKPDTYEAQNSSVAVITLRNTNERQHYTSKDGMTRFTQILCMDKLRSATRNLHRDLQSKRLKAY